MASTRDPKMKQFGNAALFHFDLTKAGKANRLAPTPGVVGMVEERMVFTSLARSDSPISTGTISIPVRNDWSSSH
jgi:hypothetical protein